MKKTILFILILSYTVFFAQTKKETRQKPEKTYYSTLLEDIAKYMDLSNKAWKKNDEKLGIQYNDSIKMVIESSYMENYRFKTLQDTLYDMSKLHKPMLFQVSASWCGPCKFEIPQLNKIAEKYAGQVDFVILFWDTKEKVQALSKLYSKKIILIPSPHQNSYSANLKVAGFQHLLGFPSNYLIASNRKIVIFDRGGNVPLDYTKPNGEKIHITKEEANKLNYERFQKEILELLAYEKKIN